MPPDKTRGQAVSIDFLVALLIVFSVLTAFDSLWSYWLHDLPADKSLEVQQALSGLVEQSAYPQNALSSQWQTPGLASSWRVLDENEVAQWMNLTQNNPQAAANLLGADFVATSFKLTYLNQSFVMLNDSAFVGNASWQYGTMGSSVFVAHAWALLNGQLVRAELKAS